MTHPANLIPRARYVQTRDALFGMVRRHINDPGFHTGTRLQVLGHAARQLARLEVVANGTDPGVAACHAAELIERLFLADALANSPGLGVWFLDED